MPSLSKTPSPVNDRILNLTPQEARILTYLQRAGRIVSPVELYEAAIGRWVDDVCDARNLYVHIHRIRRKTDPRAIRTVRKPYIGSEPYGYRWIGPLGEERAA
jgi:DNA-binding response OmpR family regulator